MKAGAKTLVAGGVILFFAMLPLFVCGGCVGWLGGASTRQPEELQGHQAPATGKRLPPGVFSENVLLASRFPGFSDGLPPSTVLMSPAKKERVQ